MTKRLFIAIDLPEALKTQLDRLCAGLPEAQWSNPNQLHVTLRFVGDCEYELEKEICEKLQEISLTQFSLKLLGLGFFPQRRNQQVIWVGLDPEHNAAELKQLKRLVDKALGPLQIKRDRTEYLPHVTLARLTHTPLPQVEAYLKHHGAFHSAPFDVTVFHLYSSRSSPNGTIHTREQSFSLLPTANSRLEQRLLEFRHKNSKSGGDHDQN